MNVEIGTEAAKFPEKEFINGIFFAVRQQCEDIWFGKEKVNPPYYLRMLTIV